MARTKQTASLATGGGNRARIARAIIAKKTAAPAPPMMQMSKYFRRALKEIKQACQTWKATSTWDCYKNDFVESNGGHFGVLIDNFQMKPYIPFVSSDTGMRITTTSILVDLPANYPFSPPRVTFKDKIAHPSIDSDGRYIGKAWKAWTPIVDLADYVSSVQHELFFAA